MRVMTLVRSTPPSVSGSNYCVPVIIWSIRLHYLSPSSVSVSVRSKVFPAMLDDIRPPLLGFYCSRSWSFTCLGFVFRVWVFPQDILIYIILVFLCSVFLSVFDLFLSVPASCPELPGFVFCFLCSGFWLIVFAFFGLLINLLPHPSVSLSGLVHQLSHNPSSFSI